MRRRLFCLAATSAAAFALPAVRAVGGAASAGTIGPDGVDWTRTPVRLLMVESPACVYCQAWHRRIGPGYAASAAGRAAPLMRTDIDGPWPDGVALARRPRITPTFILLDHGKELARLEGYSGDNSFYPLIGRMLAQGTG